jgi:hypothetical protein
MRGRAERTTECALPWALNFRYRCGPCRRVGSRAHAQDESPHCRVTSESAPGTIEPASCPSSAIKRSLLTMMVEVCHRQALVKGHGEQLEYVVAGMQPPTLRCSGGRGCGFLRQKVASCYGLRRHDGLLPEDLKVGNGLWAAGQAEPASDRSLRSGRRSQGTRRRSLRHCRASSKARWQ